MKTESAAGHSQIPWNKGKLTGQNPPLKDLDISGAYPGRLA
ncbi:hypothetical protein JOE11_004985 [Robbsia andropogonis]